MKPRQINQKGLNLIRDFEGLRLLAYKDPVGILTIGYGHTGDDVKEGQRITSYGADLLLLQDIERFEREVERLVKVPLTDNQFSALVCFVYNIGVGNFTKSTLLKCVNEKRFIDASNEFLRWNKAGGQVLPGLSRRREAERELFLDGQ